MGPILEPKHLYMYSSWFHGAQSLCADSPHFENMKEREKREIRKKEMAAKQFQCPA